MKTLELDFDDTTVLTLDLDFDVPKVSITQRLGGTLTAEQMTETARQWQTECFSKWIGLDNPRGTLKAGTGAGKTRLGIMVMMNWLKEREDATVIFVVPSLALGNQTKNSLRAWGLTTGRYFTGFKETAPHKNVYITTYTSLNKLVEAVPYLKNRNVLLVLDECHKAGASQALRNLRNFKGDGCLMLSATPERGDGVNVMAELDAPLFFELTLIDGIKQSRTADDALDYTFHVVFVQPNQQEAIEYDDLSESISKMFHMCVAEGKKVGANTNNLFDRRNLGYGGEFAQKLRIYTALCRSRKRLENELESRYQATQDILTYTYGKKTAVFNQSIFAIERLNGMVKDMGIHPRVYHSGLSSLPADALEMYPELNNQGFKRRLEQWGDDADKELKRWVRSSSDVLLTCKALQEGFDCPDMDTLIMANGTNAIRSRIQTIGRVFRGSKHKDIFMLVHNNGSDDTGDMNAFYRLIHATGIEHDKIRYHTNGINPAHITVPEDTGGINQ